MSAIRDGRLAGSHESVVWVKPWSDSNGRACLEAAVLANGQVALRQSTDPEGPALILESAEIRAFVNGVKAGLADFLLR